MLMRERESLKAKSRNILIVEKRQALSDMFATHLVAWSCNLLPRQDNTRTCHST